MKSVLLVSFALALATFALAPAAEAAPGCTWQSGSCPGIVCYGRGDMYGYLVCVGPVYCDPDPCHERILP